jgi:hypothetical protein
MAGNRRGAAGSGGERSGGSGTFQVPALRAIDEMTVFTRQIGRLKTAPPAEGRQLGRGLAYAGVTSQPGR